MLTVGRGHKAIVGFLDRERLEDGRNFQDDFARALINSLVVVIILSVDALHRMYKYTPDNDKEDNLLIE